jgi:hypothetical protein
MIRRLLIQGAFTDAEIKRFAELIREIERTRPEQHFSLLILDPEAVSTLEQAAELVASTFPRKERSH